MLPCTACQRQDKQTEKRKSEKECLFDNCDSILKLACWQHKQVGQLPNSFAKSETLGNHDSFVIQLPVVQQTVGSMLLRQVEANHSAANWGIRSRHLRDSQSVAGFANGLPDRSGFGTPSLRRFRSVRIRLTGRKTVLLDGSVCPPMRHPLHALP